MFEYFFYQTCLKKLYLGTYLGLKFKPLLSEIYIFFWKFSGAWNTISKFKFSQPHIARHIWQYIVKLLKANSDTRGIWNKELI